MKEYILCAAIHFDDGQEHTCQPSNIKTGYVVTGRRHFNVFNTCDRLMGNTSYLKIEKEQGFITNLDRFVDRVEGREIALAANQVKDIKSLRNKLFSEDLY